MIKIKILIDGTLQSVYTTLIRSDTSLGSIEIFTDKNVCILDQANTVYSVIIFQAAVHFLFAYNIIRV
jgi:hypothetical protein